jgi:hypothetical protein
MLTFENATLPTLVGFSGGVPAVENLQRAMTALAMAAPWPTANPGGVTGEVTDATAYAVAAIIGSLPGLPSQTKTLINVAMLAAVAKPALLVEAKKLITENAAVLTTAVMALTLKYNGGNAAPPPQPAGTTLTSKLARYGAAAMTTTSKVATGATASAAAAAAAQESGLIRSLFPAVPPGTPWYKNWHVWAGVGGVAVAGAVAWRVLR